MVANYRDMISQITKFDKLVAERCDLDIKQEPIVKKGGKTLKVMAEVPKRKKKTMEPEKILAKQI